MLATLATLTTTSHRNHSVCIILSSITRTYGESVPAHALRSIAVNQAPPDAQPGQADQAKDPLLRDRIHGAHLLDVRKQLAFQGYTFVSLRYLQLLDISERNGQTEGISPEIPQAHRPGSALRFGQPASEVQRP